MPKSKTLELLEDVVKTVKGLEDRIVSLETPKQPEPESVTLPVGTGISDPSIPSDYRVAVDTILNKSFDIKVNPLPDRPAFEFTIVVPKQYSNASPAHLQTYGGDYRPIILDNVLGINGVKDWATKVFNQLGQTIQTQVTMDRAKGL